jgi:hypothetical protein
MAKVKGKLTRVGKGKFGFFLMIEERDGFYFNTKFEPKAGAGDVVGIEYEPKGETRGNVKKVVLLEDNGGPKGAGGSSSGGSSNKGGGYRANPGKEASIVWQHSQEMAVRVVTALLANEAVKLPANQAKKEEVIRSLIGSYTVELFTDAQNPLESETYKTFKAENSADESEEKAPAKDDDWSKDDDSDDWGAGDDDWS